ncbi:MAG: electron transport complex subunit RsxA [Clostridia bacterium]|nr:electron transport complex subunit RsxA [Clostridia bacterium]
MERIFLILVGSILVNNFILSRFLGICPFLGVSKQIGTAVGMGMAVTFVMAMASLMTYLMQYFLLEPFGLGFLQTISYVLVVAVLVQLVEMMLKKLSYGLYKSLGVYLPLITTNCAVLGVALLNITESYNLVEAVINGVGGGLGFALAITLLAGLRERFEFTDMPKWMQGFTGTLITAGLMSVAFLGFQGFIQ